jgi:hypothetical protein
MKVRREATEAYPEKTGANPEEMKAVAEHQEVPKEEAAVETIGALGDRYRDRHLDVGCRQQLKKQTDGDCGSRKSWQPRADG